MNVPLMAKVPSRIQKSLLDITKLVPIETLLAACNTSGPFSTTRNNIGIELIVIYNCQKNRLRSSLRNAGH